MSSHAESSAEVVLHEEGSIDVIIAWNNLVRSDQLKKIAGDREGRRTVHRALTYLPPFGSLISLEHLLARADRELDIISEMTETETIGHTWGLYPSPDAHAGYPVPSGHYLIAEVDVIYSEKGTTIPPDTSSSVSDGVNQYNLTRKKMTYGLGDMSKHQFVYGENLNRPIPSLAAWMVDIEPIFPPTPVPFCFY